MEVPQVRSPEVAFVFLVGGNICVYGLCMGFGVHTALFGLIQSGSVTEGFKPCWTGQSACLETMHPF